MPFFYEMSNIIIPIKLINVEGDGFHLLAHVELNGKAAALLIDTGASKTVLDINRINNFTHLREYELNDQLSTGLGTNSMVSHSIVLENISLGVLSYENYKAVLIDLNHVNQSYTLLGFEPIDGVLGSDLLMHFKATINFETLELSLQKPD